MGINPNSGLITWTPGSGQEGNQPVSVRVDDNHGGFTTQSYAVNVQTGGVTVTEAPRRVELVSVDSITAGQIQVQWLASLDNDTPANQIRYRIHAGSQANFPVNGTTLVGEVTDATNATVGGLMAGQQYYIKIEALDLGSHASLSNELDVVVATSSPVRTGALVIDVSLAPNLIVAPGSVSYLLTGGATPPQVGDLITSSQGDGFLRRVLSVTRNGDQIEVQTENAPLNAVFSDLSFSTTTRLLDLAQTTQSTARSSGAAAAHWSQTGLTLYDEPLSPAARTLSPRAGSPTYCIGAGTTEFAADGPLQVRYPGTLCIEPDQDLRFDVNVQIDPSQAQRYEITQLQFLGLSHPAISENLPNYGAGWAVQTFSDTAGRGTLSWRPGVAQVDGKLRPYTAKFLALAKERPPYCQGIGPVTWCEEKRVELEVRIGVTWSELPGRASYEFGVSGDLVLTARSDIDFQPEIQAAARIAAGRLEYGYITLQGPVSFETHLELAANGQASAQGSRELLRKRFIKILPAPSGIPLVMSGLLVLRAEFNASADAAIDLDQTLTLGFDVAAGLQYTASGGWSTLGEATPWERYYLSGEANGHAYVDLRFVPDLSVSFYEAVTGRLILEPYLYAEAAVEGHFLHRYLAGQSGVETNQDQDYRFTQLEFGAAIDGKYRAGLEVFDQSIIGYPSANPDDLAQLELLAKTPIVGLPRLEPHQGSRTNAEGATELLGAYTNLPNPFYPLLSNQPSFNPFVEDSGKWKLVFPDGSAAITPGDQPLQAWLTGTSPATYRARFSGHGAMGSFIRQYEDLDVNHDKPGILVFPASGLITTEDGGTATFSVVLSHQPSADVVIGLASSDESEGGVSPAAVTFTSTDWATPKPVTVTGVADDLADGDVAYRIITAPAVSADLQYHGRDPTDVSVTNQDTLIRVSPTSGLVTTEAGGTATFTLVLTRQPTANVTVGLASSDASEGTVSPATVTFTPANWAAPQTATVTGVDDALADGNAAYQIITAPAVSADARFDLFDPQDVRLVNRDDEAPLPGGTTRVSVASDGTEGNADSFPVGISADGRYVTFYSNATNLAPGDTSSYFIHDRMTGETRKATQSCSNNAYNSGMLISADGRVGVTPRAYSDDPWIEGIKVANCITGGDYFLPITGIVPSNWDYPVTGMYYSGPSSISSDGAIAAFTCNISGGTAPCVIDTSTGEIRLAGREGLGPEEWHLGTFPIISADGQQMVFDHRSFSGSGYQGWQFYSWRTGEMINIPEPLFLSRSVNNGIVVSSYPEYSYYSDNWHEVFAYDVSTGTVTWVSAASSGTQANHGSWDAHVSANGRIIVFHSDASDLLPEDTNGATDVFVHDLETHMTSRVSISNSGAQVQYESRAGTQFPLSADGRYVVFSSAAPNLVDGDTNGTWDVFVRDRGPQ